MSGCGTSPVFFFAITFGLSTTACFGQAQENGRQTVGLSFVDSGQRLGTESSSCVALADVDRDNDLDAVVANRDKPAEIWLNNGKAVFSRSEVQLGDGSCIAVGDLNGDDHVDIYVARSGENRVLEGDGSGNFKDTGQSLGDMRSSSVVLGDLDGDLDLDAVVTNWKDQPRVVWLNDGRGRFTAGGKRLISPYYGSSVALGDVDGDGDLDLLACDNATQAHKPAPNRLWLNDGHGVFADSGVRLGNSCSSEAALVDADGDGDLDAFVANSSHARANPVNKVWLNDGKGAFTPARLRLGNAYSMSVGIADLDGDGDPDAYVGNYRAPDRIWLNDGHGRFHDSGLSLGRSHGNDVALADLDGDGDLDAFVANNTW